jgi:hypothetical protein
MAKRARLAARYGTLERSPDRPAMSMRRILVFIGLCAIGLTGGVVWLGGLTVKKQGDHYRVVRRERAPGPAEEAPAEPATTRADGRLVG